MTITEVPSADPVAAKIGRAIAVANQRAATDAFDTTGCELLITPTRTVEGARLVRIDYMPTYAEGFSFRGGSYMVEVEPETGVVYRALWGQ